MRKRILFILCLTLCILGICGCGKEELKEETFTEKYVAYVQINPSVKLAYSRSCKKVGDAEPVCEKPLVDSYELVNDDAKEIYKDIDLLAETKDLSKVIELLCDTAKEKGIEVKNVEIKSDWEEFSTYFETARHEEIKENQNNENTTTTDNNEILFNVNTQTEEQITVQIETDVQEEIKAKEEAEKKAQEEAEAKAKAEAEAKAKEEAETIYLADRVTFNHSMRSFCCDACFSDALINSLKNVKGTVFVSGDSSQITIKTITGLSGKYNTTTFKGTGVTNKITAAGGEECGGAGGSGDPLTTAVCSEYHLKCK